MNEYEKKIKALEEKVKILEETLETVKKMQMSEQMQSYIQEKTRALKMAELINSISDKPELDLGREQDVVEEMQAKKKSVDDEIAIALRNSKHYSDECTTDVNFFEYEIESGIGDNNRLIQELSEYVGKGIRITAYTGFDCESIIIPKSINGLPVTSIGEKAFLNLRIKKIVLPNTVIAILLSAFNGCEELVSIEIPDSTIVIKASAFENCRNLSHVDLPKNLVDLGEKCFAYSGLTYITIPGRVKTVKYGSFEFCNNLETVTLGNSVEKIEDFAFDSYGIRKVVIPTSVKTVSNTAFGCEEFLSRCKVECAFLGAATTVTKESFLYNNRFGNVKMIYCQPGSSIQKYAREHNIPIKPLSEFKSEE